VTIAAAAVGATDFITVTVEMACAVPEVTTISVYPVTVVPEPDGFIVALPIFSYSAGKATL
jgi:hypothetical protein